MWTLQNISFSFIRWSTIMREDVRVFFLDAQGASYVGLQLLKVVSLPCLILKSCGGDYRPGQSVGGKDYKVPLGVWLPSGL